MKASKSPFHSTSINCKNFYLKSAAKEFNYTLTQLEDNNPESNKKIKTYSVYRRRTNHNLFPKFYSTHLTWQHYYPIPWMIHLHFDDLPFFFV